MLRTGLDTGWRAFRGASSGLRIADAFARTSTAGLDHYPALLFRRVSFHAAAASGLCLTLAACATPAPPLDPKIEYRPADIAVATSCIPADLSAPPPTQTVAAIRALPTPQARMQAAYVALALHEQRSREVEPAILNCRKEK